MNKKKERKMIAESLFKLLPVQILLALTGGVSGFISSFFASNYVGVEAMGAIGLYFPVSTLLSAISAMLMGGSVIICGKYLGQNNREKAANTISLDFIVAIVIGGLAAVLILVLGMFNLTGFFTSDPAVRPLFNRYLMGQALGMIPFMAGNQLMAFLSLENQGKRTTFASIVYIAVNTIFDFLFLAILHMEAFGLAMASSIAMWAMMAVELQYFLVNKSILKFDFKNLNWREFGEIIMIGAPGAASNGYQALRGIIMNHLIETFVGGVGLSAFAAVNNILSLFWAIPAGMLAVSRMFMSVAIGEEDRKTLTDVMFVMFAGFLPLMCIVSALIMAGSVPLTMILFQNTADPVFKLTVTGVRIIPLCMPLSVIVMHFACYGQASGKRFLLNLVSLLDGVVCVAGFTALTIRFMGMNSVYAANVFNGVFTVAVLLIYSCIMNHHFPRNLEELMVIPKNFGAPEDMRIDIAVESLDDVVTVSQRIHSFALDKGVDRSRAYASALAMEEMAANIIKFTYPLDRKKNMISVRVVYKPDVDPEEAGKNSPMYMTEGRNNRIRFIDRVISRADMQRWHKRFAELLPENSILAEAFRERKKRFETLRKKYSGKKAIRKTEPGSEAVGSEEIRAEMPDTGNTVTGDVIMRIKDNCAPYNLDIVQELIEKEDPDSMIGLRIVLLLAKKVEFQNILGMNALTIRI